MNLKKELNYAGVLMEQTTTGQTVYKNYDKIMYLGGDNIRGLMQKINIHQPKDSFVVSSSGDPGVEMAYQGFSNITCFDINFLSRHMLFFKIAAIKALNYQEFCQLFQGLLNPVLLEKIFSYLPNDTLYFFENILKMGNTYKIKNLFTHYFSKNTDRFFQKCQQNFSVYNEQEFNEIKRNLQDKNFKFIHLDIFCQEDVQKKLEKYDFIYLSNILFFASIPIETFLEIIFPYFYQSLKDGGVLVVNYFHSFALEVKEKRTLKNRIYQEKNRLIYEQLKRICNQEIILKPSGFGHGTGQNDLVLAIKK